MKSPPGPVRTPDQAKPEDTSRASTPRTSGTRSGTPAKAGAKARPDVRDAGPVKARKDEKPVVLSGGNPRVAMGDGDAPVQAFIAGMPGWKRDSGSVSTRSSCGACPVCARP